MRRVVFVALLALMVGVVLAASVSICGIHSLNLKWVCNCVCVILCASIHWYACLLDLYPILGDVILFIIFECSLKKYASACIQAWLPI